MIQIIPAIDIMDGKCVRLVQGDYGRQKTYSDSPVEMAAAFASNGVRRIHMVDLDGAKAGMPVNTRILRQVAEKTGLEIEWGGGISSAEALRTVFDAGCNHAVIGSVAALRPDMFESWLLSFSGSRITLGADVRNGKVAVKGWLEDSPLTIFDLLDRFAGKGLEEVICTDISRDGMLSGPDCGFYAGLQEKYPGVDVIVSGGISSIMDIEALNALGLRKVIVGKAIYEGNIKMEELGRWSGRG